MTLTAQSVPPTLRRLIDRLVEVKVTRGFYLAGGTGLALLLNHRRSVDVDFFSRTNQLDVDGRRVLLTHLRRIPGWRALDMKDGTLHGTIGRVRVSFFWYPLL